MQKYSITRGDTVPIEIEYRLDGVPVDILGYTPMLSAKRKLSDTGYLFSKTGAPVPPTSSGVAVVTLDSTDTATACRNAVAEAVLVDAAGKQYTYGQFLLDIEDDVYV